MIGIRHRFSSFALALTLATSCQNAGSEITNNRSRGGSQTSPAGATIDPLPGAPGSTPGSDAPDGNPSNGSGDGGGSASTQEFDFEQAGVATPVSAAYLTAYRDAPNALTIDAADVQVFAVIRDQATGLPLPKPLAIELATASFDDSSLIVGEVNLDATSDYHVRFRVPKAQLAAESIGKDRILGKIRVESSTVAPTSALETSVVIWLANVALVADRGDYGTLVIPPAGQDFAPIKLNVIVSGTEQPAQRALLKGLGGELAIVGGSCPLLGETTPADLAADCEVALAPTDATIFDRVLTLSYYNGVRMDFASVVIRGESAVVLGHADGETFTAEAGASGLEEPVQVAFKGGRLLAVDRGHDRVAIWDGLPKRSNAVPAVSVGGPNPPPRTNAQGYFVYESAATSMFEPNGVESDGTNLIVADSRNFRILIWRTMPTANGTPADVVLGSSSFLSSVAPPGATLVGSSTFVLWDGAHLISSPGFQGSVREQGGAATVWTGMPDHNLEARSGKLGTQYFDPQFGEQTNRAVGRLLFDGTRYLEALRDRIRVFTSWPIDYDNPAFVLGETDAAKHTAYSNCLCSAFSDGTRLVATKPSSVHVWSTLPQTASTPPDHVLGQPDTAAQAPNFFGASVDSLNEPGSAILVGDLLVIADTGNHRIVIRPAPRPRPDLELPVRDVSYLDGESAPGIVHFTQRYLQLGNVDVAATTEREVALIYSGNTPVKITATSFDDGALGFVGGSFPGTGGTCASVIEASCTLRIVVLRKSAGGLRSSLRVAFDDGIESRDAVITVLGSMRHIAVRSLVLHSGKYFYETVAPGGSGRLVVSDAVTSCTVKIYPSTSFSATPLVIGPGDDNACTLDDENYYGASGFARDSRLYVASDISGKTSVWRSIPTAADTQPDFLLSSADAGGTVIGGKYYLPSASQLKVWGAAPDSAAIGAPESVIVAPTLPAGASLHKVFSLENRFVAELFPTAGGVVKLLSWNAPPTAGGAAADASFEFTATYDREWLDYYHYSVTTDGTRLFIADAAHNRVLVWKGFPVTGQAPDFVLGQLDPRGDAVNDGGIGLWSLALPSDMFVQDGELFVKDIANNRIMVYDLSKL